MYVCVSVLRYTYESVVPTEIRGNDAPRVGVTDCCEPPNILGTPTMHGVLCKSRILGPSLWPLPYSFLPAPPEFCSSHFLFLPFRCP